MKQKSGGRSLAARICNGSEVENSGCWIWKRCKQRQGYGRIRVAGKTEMAHRVSYEVFVGPILGDWCVCHKCDTPSCVNPDHLFLGTYFDNNADKIAKARQPSVAGEKNPRAKITDEQAREILASVASLTELANKYGLTYKNVWNLKRGITWGHL